MKKPVKIHILPTFNANPINPLYIELDTNKLIYIDFVSSKYKVTSQLQPQHLYFTSDEEIKKGDWYYWINNPLHYHNGILKSIEDKPPGGICRKIVATTDKSICVRVPYEKGDIRQSPLRDTHLQYLPQIPQQFIEEYVKAGGIDEVYLEYEYLYGDDKLMNIEDNPTFYKLKLDQNNCVITHPVEPKFYTKEEVEMLIRKHSEFIDKTIDYDGIMNATTAIGTPEWDDIKWIKENLK